MKRRLLPLLNRRRTAIAFAAPAAVTFTGVTAFALATFTASAEPIDEQALMDWLSRYEHAWESRDPEAASRIFTEDALYYETPYAEPFRGRQGIADYWAGVTADQRDVDFTSEVIAVADDVSVAHWNAKLTMASTGERAELDGIFLLRFGEDGLVSELKEWWVVRP